MFNDLARWVYGAHWRGWLLKAAATVAYMLAAQGVEDVTGWQVRHEAAAMWRGYYLFDTAKDIALNDDPWYDHALDTGIPWAISLGMEIMAPKSKEEILTTETSPEFWAMMQNRMLVSYFKYGAVRENAFQHDAIADMKKRITLYEKTGNTEWLVDAANFAMIEFMYPQHKDGHFRATDSDESPGVTKR